jgi:hypothetical protein
MCISCGCGRFEESHGDERNITVATLQRAAAASNLRMDEVLNSMREGCGQMLSAGVPDHQSQGQAVKERLRDD